MTLKKKKKILIYVFFFFLSLLKKGEKTHYLTLDVEGDEDLNEGYIFTFIIHLFSSGNHAF